MIKVIKVAASVLRANDTIALENQAAFRDNNVFVVNVMGSPGAGKTTLLIRTIEALRDNIRIGVIEGDIATSHDAELIQATGVPVVQINTEGACHLDAMMIKMALTHFNLAEIDLLFIENVGNLVCPAGFRLGENARIVVSSVPEGDDKPKKYPGMFRVVDGVVLNKIDLLHAFEFNVNTFKEGVGWAEELPIFEVSCKTKDTEKIVSRKDAKDAKKKDGLLGWLDWLRGCMIAC